MLGGARSGKSAFAERVVSGGDAVTYVATAQPRPDDPEWCRRIAEHRRRRPASWRTVETTDLGPVLRDRSGPLLIDCATLWLTAVMENCGLWAGADAGTETKLAAHLDELEHAWRTTPAYAVLVSNEAGCGIVPATYAGRRFRDELGSLNTRLAAHAEEVWLVTAGIPRRLR